MQGEPRDSCYRFSAADQNNQSLLGHVPVALERVDCFELTTRSAEDVRLIDARRSDDDSLRRALHVQG